MFFTKKIQNPLYFFSSHLWQSWVHNAKSIEKNGMVGAVGSQTRSAWNYSVCVPHGSYLAPRASFFFAKKPHVANFDYLRK